MVTLSIIYLAILPALVIGFEYKDFEQLKAVSFKSSKSKTLKAAQNGSKYCLVFEDQFNTFNLKTWQVK